MSTKIPEMPPTQLNVDPAKLPNLMCSRCQNQTFQEVVIFKKVSALLSPNGRAGLSPMPTFACVACGHVDAAFLPRGSVDPTETPATEAVSPTSETPKPLITVVK